MMPVPEPDKPPYPPEPTVTDIEVYQEDARRKQAALLAERIYGERLKAYEDNHQRIEELKRLRKLERSRSNGGGLPQVASVSIALLGFVILISSAGIEVSALLRFGQADIRTHLSLVVSTLLAAGGIITWLNKSIAAKKHAVSLARTEEELVRLESEFPRRPVPYIADAKTLDEIRAELKNAKELQWQKEKAQIDREAADAKLEAQRAAVKQEFGEFADDAEKLGAGVSEVQFRKEKEDGTHVTAKYDVDKIKERRSGPNEPDIPEPVVGHIPLDW